jgi:RNA polymerase sigma factor (sigma-70 family)
MATSQMSEVLQHLRRTVLQREAADLTDGQLLEDYLSRGDEAALAALVRRHGPMVWGVCRRVLRNYHDAEEAFQATFLVLVRKAASINSRALVANWLYGVAHQTALKAKATAARRRERERQVAEMPDPVVSEQDCWPDLQPLLDKELSRLPDRYRSVIVLCDLEGKTRKEAARQLGCPEGTVAGWLARARTILARRLALRGVVLSGGALAVVLSENAASASVPTALVSSTLEALTAVRPGKAALETLVSAKVLALTEGVMKTMLVTKLQTMAAVSVLGMVILVSGLVAMGPGNASADLAAKRAARADDKPKGVSDRSSRVSSDLPADSPEGAGDKGKEAEKAPERKQPALEKALEIAKAMEITDNGDKIRLLASIAAAQASAGDKEGAGKTFQLALDLVKEVGQTNGVYKVGAFGAIARNQIMAGDLDGVRKTLAAVRKLMETTDDETIKLNAGFVVSGIAVEIAAAQARAGDARRALKTAEEIDDLHRRIIAYRLIAVEQARRKDFSGALETLAQVDSIRKAEMLMEVAIIQEKTAKTGAAKTWKLVLDALGKVEISDEKDLDQMKLETVIGNLAERGHGEAVVRWIGGLHSPAAQVRLLLALADRK